MDRPKLWTREFSLLTMSNMLYVFGFYMLMPTIPLFVMAQGGANTQVGLVASSFTIAAILMRFFTPILLTKINKKMMLRIGLVLSFVVTVSCGAANSVAMVGMFRVLQGLGFGIVSTICSALAADLLPDTRRGEGIGYFGMGTTLMVAFSPAIGLAIVNAGIDFWVVFLVASVGQLISLLVLQFFAPPQDIIRVAPRITSIKVLLKNLYDPRLVLQTVLLVLFGICRSAEQNFLSTMAKERAISLEFYFIFQTAVSFVAKFATGKMFDRKGPAWAVIPGGVSLLIAMMIFSYADSSGVMLIAGFFSGLGMGALLPGMQSWTITSVDANQRSMASAVYYNFYDIGQTIGAIILGKLADQVGYGGMFRSAGVPMVLFLMIFIAAVIIRTGRSRKQTI